MERREKESKSAATIRRRTHRSAALGDLLSYRHKAAAGDETLDSPDEEDVAVVEPDVPIGGPKLARLMSSQWTLFLGLLAFRLLNAMVIQTAYVPDEYWQSIEVAHHMVFGYGHLTWEWHHGLRGYTYPLVFAVIYKFLAILHLDSRMILTKVPRLVQGLFAAVGDIYLYRFSLRVSGPGVARWALLCQVTSWFTFYCCTRTLTNSLEAVLTTMALYYYPLPGRPRKAQWKYVTLVALAVVVRPTAAITWVPLCVWHLCMWRHLVWKVVKHCAERGIVVVLLSSIVDRVFYGKWVNVQFNFLQFNFLSDLGSFYGTHPWYWYLTQGFVVVTGSHVVPFLVGVRRGMEPASTALVFWTLAVYSVLSHKEFRFLLGILPLVMHVCGNTLHFMLDTSLSLPPFETRDENPQPKPASPGTEPAHRRPESVHPVPWKTVTVVILIALNVPVALYTSLIHQRGTIDVMSYLHREAQRTTNETMNVLYLMPCHSTPYYSYLHRNITMRFLTCEPNLDRVANYTDEADQFYRDPPSWLTEQYFTPHGPGHTPPSHIVMFDELGPRLATTLRDRTYKNCDKFFHTDFPEGRVSTFVVVMCSEWWSRSVSRHDHIPKLFKT